MTPDDKTHMTFGGSSAYRWLRCPGSIKLCATLPPQVENEHMAAGTRAHALLELAVRERRIDVSEFEDVALRPNWPMFTADDIAAVQVALDYVNSILDRDPNHLLFVERQVALSDDVGGTADVVIYLPSTRTLHVVDYKHGRRYVEADDNPQLKLYAAATMFGFTEAQVDVIYGTIIQPRAFTGDPIRSAVYGPADLIAYSDDVDAAVALAREPGAPLVPGDEQCHWCPASHICPALHKSVVSVPDAAMSWMMAEPETDTVLTLPSPDRMRSNPAALADTLKAAWLLQSWIAAVEDAATAFATSGGVLPGFKLTDKRPSRKWADPAAAQAWLAASTMLDEDDYAPRKLSSPAQVEKLVKAASGKDGVKALAEHVVKESSGLKLVPDTAKGDAVNPLQLTAAGFAGAVTV